MYQEKRTAISAKAKKSHWIKLEILQQEHITCSIGVGPNKLLAKIGSDEKKPNGLTIVKPEDVKRVLSKLPVSRIPGVGKKVEEKLSSCK